MTLYAHLETSEGGMFGFDVVTPQRWEISNRDRPTSKCSYPLDDCISTVKFLLTKSTASLEAYPRFVVCTYQELEPYIDKELNK